MRRLLAASLSLLASLALAATAAPRSALLLAAHGAPSRSWCQPVLALAPKVDSLFRSSGERPFATVVVGFLEFADPTLAEAVHQAEEAGADTIYVLPLFVAPSGHTVRDLPNALGLAADPETQRELREEGTAVVRTHAHLIVGPTLSYGDFLQEALLRQVGALSSQPDSEALVLLAHGDPDFRPVWERLLRQIGAFVCGRTGITYFTCGFVGMGREFASEGLPALQRAAEARPRVLVASVYLNFPASKLARRHGDELREAGLNPGGGRLIFSDAAIVADPELPGWIVRTALEMRQALR